MHKLRLRINIVKVKYDLKTPTLDVIQQLIQKEFGDSYTLDEIEDELIQEQFEKDELNKKLYEKYS